MLLVIAGHQGVHAAEEFGRFFTTPRQRQQLDELRKARSGNMVIDISDEEVNLDEEAKVEEEVSGGILVKGLVHRSDGKNTAWINESNSYEGDLSSQFTGVVEKGISNDRVEVEMKDEEGKNLSLKVGEFYNPVTRDVKDITDSRPETVKVPDTE